MCPRVFAPFSTPHERRRNLRRLCILQMFAFVRVPSFCFVIVHSARVKSNFIIF